MTDTPEDDVAESLARLVQGSVIELRSLPVLSTGVNPLLATLRDDPGPFAGQAFAIPAVMVDSAAAVVLTQTCDLQPAKTLGGRALVQVAPVLMLDGKDAEYAERLTRPHLVPLPWYGRNAFADMEQAVAVDRALVARCEHLASPTTEDERRRLAYLMGRCYSRPGLPNAIVDALAPLADKARDGKHVAVRRVLDEGVVSIRVRPRPEYGQEPKVFLTVYFILQRDWYPDAEPIALDRTLGKQLHDVAIPLVAAFDALDISNAGLIRTLWNELLARLQAVLDEKVAANPDWPVSGFSLEPVTSLNYDEWTSSDALDLNHLSV